MREVTYGMALGVVLSLLIFLLAFRCSFGWHKWGSWAFDCAGRSQFRICRECNVYQAMMFRDRRTGEHLTQLKVEQAKPSRESLEGQQERKI